MEKRSVIRFLWSTDVEFNEIHTLEFYTKIFFFNHKVKKGKAIPITGRGGP
jgi:hypothetical protein